MIGVVGRPHGVRGAVRMRATGVTVATLRTGESLTFDLGDGTRRTSILEGLSPHGDGWIMHVEGIDTRDDAEALRGATIVIAEDLLPALEDDEYYVRDMIGCRVFVGVRELGTVADVLPGSANDVLEVTPTGSGATVLVPFTRDAIPAIDMDQRTISVREGLLEA